MDTLETDHFLIELPEEWFAEQDDETVLISDESEVSTIELTPILIEKGVSKDNILADVLPANAVQTVLGEQGAFYHELSEDGVFWREWVCELPKGILIASHGMDEENKGMDDAIVDEILSTLHIIEAQQKEK